MAQQPGMKPNSLPWNSRKVIHRTYVSRHVPSQDLVGQAVDKLQLYIPCFYFSTCVDFTSTAARASLCCQRLNKAKMGTAPSTH